MVHEFAFYRALCEAQESVGKLLLSLLAFYEGSRIVCYQVA